MKKRKPNEYIIQDLIFARAHRQGMSIPELARRIGTYPQMVRNWEKHYSMMSMDYAERCFEELNKQAQEIGMIIY